MKAGCVVHAAKSVRTGIAGQDGVHGFSEMPAIPAIEFDVSMRGEISAEDFQLMDDETVMAEMANGTVYTLRNAWKAGAAEHNAAEGTMRVRFEGMDIQEFA